MKPYIHILNKREVEKCGTPHVSSEHEDAQQINKLAIVLGVTKDTAT